MVKFLELRKSITPGVRLMLLATFSFAMMQTLVKELQQFNTFEIFFFRGAVSMILCMVYLKYFGIPMIGTQHKWLFGRAFSSLIATLIFYYTLKIMPFGAAVALKYLSPIFAAIFAIFIVKEKLKAIQWFFFLLAIIGVVLLKGFDVRIELWALLLALSASIIGGFAFIFIRKIGKSEHPLVIVNYYMVTATVITGLLMLPYWQTPTTNFEWGALIGIGVTGFIAQFYMTRAMQIESVNRMAPLKYLELIYALLVGFFWYGESYTLFAFLGITLIMIGMVLNVVVGKR